MKPTAAPLTLALTKGRILRETLPLLARAGIAPEDDILQSRKLLFPSGRGGLQLLVLRGADVPTYVRHGAADLGVVGKDVLLERGAEGLYEPLDLGIARCRLMTAALAGAAPPAGRVRAATKFTQIARRWFAERGQHADIIGLYGALELAPVMGLADLIVDIVDTGDTLRANGLEPRELITELSARLIVNRAAMRSKRAALQDIIAALAMAAGKAAGPAAGSKL